jgi:serine/threonine-protein kinase NIM1
MKFSAYQRILYFLDSDERWQREIALGRRIGFYRFRGDIGNGNFSQVKVAIHGLTKGIYNFSVTIISFSKS